MRKVIGIGETVLDIIFKNEQPIGAYPGGSAFNALISLGRCGVDARLLARPATTAWASISSGFCAKTVSTPTT